MRAIRTASRSDSGGAYFNASGRTRLSLNNPFSPRVSTEIRGQKLHASEKRLIVAFMGVENKIDGILAKVTAENGWRRRRGFAEDDVEN